MLTTQQRDIIKSYIEADPVLSVIQNTEDGSIDIANAINAVATPDFYVWKKSITRHEIIAETSLVDTTFTWAGGGYITRSQGERDAFREMFNSTGAVDPRKPSIINAFNDIFSGAGGAPNRTHITAISKRKATIFEKLLATGTGSLVTPATLAVEGPIDYREIHSIRNP